MKRILIDAYGTNSWIGGLYYKRNVVFSLLQNKYITSTFEIVVITNLEGGKLFKAFLPKIKIKIAKSILDFYAKFSFLVFFKKVSFVFPSRKIHLFPLHRICYINWIPDLQHVKMPEFFSQQEIDKRNHIFSLYCKSKKQPLIVSSFSSLKDLKSEYTCMAKVYVLHFVSFIEPEIKKFYSIDANSILYKYGIEKNRYFCISNQFWRHKNHIVVFKAIKKIILENKNFKYKFVFTGSLNDYRDPDYIKEIKRYVDDPIINPWIIITGFIDRIEQLLLMKNSLLIIQPSLFEGWGTVLEDAKVLNKKVILSDILIHQEQKNDNCILFNPLDYNDLSDKIIQNLIPCDSEYNNFSDMYSNAALYSLSFEKLCRDFSNKR